MNRKQKQKQIKELQARCEIIKQQAQIDIYNIKKYYSEREDYYLEHIQNLQNRLLDGKHYVTERVCVNVAKENPCTYEWSNLPLSEIERYREQKIMDMILRELCKRTDLLQRTEYPDRTRFYMEVLKLDDRPVPTLTIPREYTGSPFEEK